MTDQSEIDRLRECNRELVEALRHISVIGILNGQNETSVGKRMRYLANAALAKAEGGEG
jgi:hypothetical protein